MMNEEGLLREIKKRIMLSQNGAIEGCMSAKGVQHIRNYGVGHARLKEIAAQFPYDSVLCEQLWELAWRESRLLFVYMQDSSDLKNESVLNKLADITDFELAEQISFHLFPKLESVEELLWHNISEKPEIYKAVFYRCLAVKIKNNHAVDTEILKKAVQFSLNKLKSSRVFLKNAIGFFIRELARKEGCRDYLTSFENEHKDSKDLFVTQLLEDVEFFKGL